MIICFTKNRGLLPNSSLLSLSPREKLHGDPLLIHSAPLLDELHHGGLRNWKPLLLDFLRVLKHPQMIHHCRASRSWRLLPLTLFHEWVREVSLAREPGIHHEAVHHPWKVLGCLGGRAGLGICLHHLV